MSNGSRDGSALNVGDRVRVYGGIPGTAHLFSGPATVTRVNPEGHPTVQGPIVGADEPQKWNVMRQQCRRLKKRELMSVWVKLEPRGPLLHAPTHVLSYPPVGCDAKSYVEFIEVRRGK